MKDVGPFAGWLVDKRLGAQGATTLVTVVFLMIGGCGGSSPLLADAGVDAGKNLQLFLGTWVPTSSSITLTCGGQASTDHVTENDVWQKGTTSDLLQPPDSSGCPLLANVSGNTATALPGQKCTENMSGVMLELTVLSYTFVVGVTGTTAQETATGAALVTNGATTTTCSYAESAMYSEAP